MNTCTLTLLPSGRTFAANTPLIDSSAKDLTAYERDTLDFCQQWWRGQADFALQTSGSTGTPKPIALTRKQMAASAQMTGKVLGLAPGDAALVNLNTRYIGGLMMLVRGMELGLQLVVVEPTALPLRNFTDQDRFDFFSFVPLQLQTTLRDDPGKVGLLSAAKAILVGGAPVSEDVEEMVQAITAPVYQTYGMTETVSHVALRRLNGPARQDYYTVLNGVRISTDDRSCAVIHTHLPGLKAVVTNDVIEMLSPGTFRWLGRADHVINSGGVKVQAEKIEGIIAKKFAELSIKKRFFVSGIPHPNLGEAVALLVEGDPLPNQTEEYLNQLLLSALSKYELPKSIRYLSSFAETPTGKIDKRRTLALPSTAG